MNTCAVTGEAVRQAKQAIRRARRENPEARIIVTGCAAQTDAELVAQPERDAIQQHAHKTAGVAATFGFAILGQKALSVEQLMSHTQDELPWSVARPEVEALLDEMEDALDEFV